MKRATQMLCAVVIATCLPASPSAAAQELDGEGAGDAAGFSEPAVSVYGYVETTAATRFDDAGTEDPAFGGENRTRLKAEWQPQDEITARLEALHTYRTGILNSTLTADELGLTPAGTQAGDPNDDYLSKFELDHAWASVNLGWMDLSLGKMPIAWGSGYVFNPTDHLNAAGSLEGREAETPGTVALAPTAYIGRWALGGYMALEQTQNSRFALEGGTEPENLPFGVRLRGYVAGFDLAVSAAREVRYTGAPGGEIPDGAGGWTDDEGYRRTHYLGLDTIGTLGDLGVYLEAALRAPQDGNKIDFGAEYDPEEAVEAAAGLEYTFADGWSGGGLSLKMEYAHLGAGASSTEDYDLTRLFDGSAITLAEDYLFLYGSQTYIDFLELTLSSLVNLNDGSFALLPEALYSFHQNFEGTLALTLPFGTKGTEFDGRIDGDGFAEVDIAEPEVSISVKASF